VVGVMGVWVVLRVVVVMVRRGRSVMLMAVRAVMVVWVVLVGLGVVVVLRG